MKDHIPILALASVFLLAYSCFGSPVTQIPFQVSGSEQKVADQSLVLGLPDGGFFVFWSGSTYEDAKGTTDITVDYDIYAKIYNSDGTERKSQFIINNIKTGRQHSPVIAQQPDGRILVVWKSYINSQTMTYDNGKAYMYYCILNIDGTKEVEDVMLYQLDFVSFTSLINGKIIAWDSRDYYLSDVALTTLNYTDFDYAMKRNFIALDSGGYLHCPYYNTGILVGSNETYNNYDGYCHWYDGAYEGYWTQPLFSFYFDFSNKFTLSTSATMLSDGNILVIWTSAGPNKCSTCQFYVNGKIYAQTANPFEYIIKPDFVIGMTGSSSTTLLPIIVSPNGEFLVVWCTNTTFQTNCYGRRYKNDYTPKDEAIMLFEYYAFFLDDISLTLMNNGSFLAVSSVNDCKSSATTAVIIPPEGNVVIGSRPDNYTNYCPNDGAKDASNTGLIVGIVVSVVSALLVVFCIVSKVRKMRMKKEHTFIQVEKEEIKTPKQKKGLNGELQLQLTPQRDNMLRFLTENDDAPIRVFQDNGVQMIKDRDIIEKNKLRGVNDTENVSKPNEMDFAFRNDAQNARNISMDERSAKPFIKGATNLQFASTQDEETGELKMQDMDKGKEENKAANQHKEEKETPDKVAVCIVCETSPSTMVFLDCMHICTCQVCSVKLRSSSDKCPVCKEVIRDARKVLMIYR